MSLLMFDGPEIYNAEDRSTPHEETLLRRPPIQERLVINLFHQEKTLWCWAACIRMVVSFLIFPRSPNSAPQQCEIANFGLVRNDCCPGNDACNDTIFTVSDRERDHRAVYGHFGVSTDFTDGQISFDQIRFALRDMHPIQVCFKYSQGAHVVVLKACIQFENGHQYVWINDPWERTESYISFSELQNAEGLGQWVETFILQRK